MSCGCPQDFSFCPSDIVLCVSFLLASRGEGGGRNTLPTRRKRGGKTAPRDGYDSLGVSRVTEDQGTSTHMRIRGTHMFREVHTRTQHVETDNGC